MSSEAKVGLFVTIGLILLFLLSTQVNRFQGFAKEGYVVEAIIDDASGLESHAKVKMKGVEIGYVKDINLAGTKVVLTLFIYKNAKIPSDSQVLLTQESLLGGKYINIIPGADNHYLADNGKITKQKPMASMEEMASYIADAAEELKLFIGELRETFDPESRDNLKKTFSNLEKLTADLEQMVSNNRDGIDSMVENINEAAIEFAQMSSKFSNSADTINADLPDILSKIESTLEEFKSVGGTLNERLPTIADRFEKLEVQLSELIEENKEPLNSALTSFDGFFKKGTGTIDKLEDYLDSVTQSKLELALNTFYMGNDGNFKGGFHLDYMPTYTRHYMIDIVSSPDYTQMRNGAYLADLDHSKSKFFVSAQIGKRYEDFMLRGGIIESTAGGGVDYFAYYDKLKLSLEAFDFNAVNDLRGTEARLRAIARYRFFKHIDAYMGLDNILNSEAFNIFFGLGVHFEDDRIKYLLGSGASAGASASQ